ncbi:hypothetical protein DITRI_Ditri19aG0062500 [Diplodiscus trichospermus]
MIKALNFRVFVCKDLIMVVFSCDLSVKASNVCTCGRLKLANGQGETWCVAKPSTNDTLLVSNIYYACAQLGTLGKSCNLIQEDGDCYYPDTLINHASAVMNYYYQAFGRHNWECDFSGSGLITVSDPSYESCQYPLVMPDFQRRRMSLSSMKSLMLHSGSSEQLRPSALKSSLKTWCIANPLSSSSALAAVIEYVCSQLDCCLIKPNGPCFGPNNQIHHASFVMNLYYQANGRHLANCDFKNSGLVSLTDPSKCHSNIKSEPLQLPGTWCVAKPGTSDDLLQQNINFACSQVDCSQTHSGGLCFYPTTLINHASYAMNLYYQTTGRKKSSCDFRETGLVVSNDPSYGNCSYQCPSRQ